MDIDMLIDELVVKLAKKIEEEMMDDIVKEVLKRISHTPKREVADSTIAKKIVTEKDIRNLFLPEGSKIKISRHAIISDLAMEYAREKRINFERSVDV